ncbi:serine/threonine-protein kinase mTOR-like [Uloborus diversus]|uniref:serine/threonine-protein kinase mTOR-like n=1 Tax=Uloborus diversus TaxID=327109 RepID=UPI002409B0EE|nr:serine/threonine-protein kinase mTOR-like [Uloborus diversus]
MAATSAMQVFVSGLKSKNEEVRLKTTRDLHHYITTELREMSTEDVTVFLDEFNHHIFEMVSSSDANDRKGGILAIVNLLGINVGNTAIRTSRFVNYLRNLLPSSDSGVMELAAYAIGRLALVSANYTAEYVEFEAKRAFEWLSGDRHEAKRHSAVLVLRELAVSTPTFFFQQVQQFFDCIFNAARDPKASIREAAVAALRAALVVTAQRETKETQKPHCYKQCYDEAVKGFEEASKEKVTRDEKSHGSLLVINELLRCSNVEGEMIRQELEDIIQQQASHEAHGQRYSFLKELGTGSLTKSFRALHQLHHSSQSGSQKGIGLSAVVKYHKALGTYPGIVMSSRRIQVFESSTCKSLMIEHFDTICVQVLRFRTSKNVHIQQILLSIIPRLAAFQTKRFVKSYLQETMAYLLVCLRRDRERYNAFNAVGLLAVAVKMEIKNYIPKIMEVIRSSLPSKDMTIRKKVPLTEPAVFTCISMLARAVGHAIMNDIKELLEPMLATGLSPALTASMRELATQIPQLKKDIQEGLLKMLSIILMRRSLRHPGMPKHLANQSSSSSQHHQNLLETTDVASVTLALKTLGSFDFQGRPLMMFVRCCAESYLSSESKEIRLEAVRTCCKLLSPAIQSMKSSGRYSPSLMSIVQEVLAKLLMVGVTDADQNVRYCVLASLDEKFDPHLAQAENLNALLIALNDEMFEIRELALCTLGRLSAVNPAYVMPTLRKVLIQILTELEHSGIGRNKEQSAKMLGHLGANAPRLIRPYMEPILNVLIPKLRDPDPNPGVTISVLAAIGEQAQVSGVEMKKWVDQLMPILLDMMQDSSSLPKREVALWTLGQMIESTGYVIEPYKKYPTLLELLLNFLKTEQSSTIRREAIRVLGLLGALDPFKYKVNQGLIDQSGETSGVLSIGSTSVDNQEMSASEMLVNMSGSLDEFYPQIAIVTLMKIIRDPLLNQHHSMAVHAITFLFKSMGISAVPYLPQVMPSFINIIKNADQHFREFLFQQLCQIISIVKLHIRNYLDSIFSLLKEFWTLQSPMQSTIILLIEQVVGALGAEFKVYLPQLIPHFLRVFMHDFSPNRTITIKLLVALQKFGNNLDDYVHLILPPIVKLFDSPEVPIAVQRCALETVDHLSETLDFTEFASRILQPLVRNLDTVPELRPTAMDTLCSIVVQLGKKYQIFIPMVNKVTAKHRISHQRYDVLISRIIKGTSADENDDPLMYAKKKIVPKSHDTDISTTGSDVANPRKKLPININNLQRAWASARRVSRDDWLEWLKRMSVVLLKESPSPALRSCCALAESYDQLPRDMFNAIFLSCWSELQVTQQNELSDSLQQALTTQNIPEITQSILNLAEFMEHCEKGPLPLKATLLGEKAMECRAYAKALHYKEDEFHKGPTSEILETLISINNKLHQPEAAAGVLEYAMKNHGTDLKVKERWYEKLHKWDKALTAYQHAREQRSDDLELIMGQMRCLEVLGEWGQLHQLSSETWPTSDEAFRQKIAPISAAAAWGLGHWESMEEYIQVIPKGTTDSAFYHAILNIHRNDFHSAQQFIDKARDVLDTELTALAGESYSRAYNAMVLVQMMSELEEVIQFKLIPERRDAIKQKWWDRLQGCQRIVEDWQKIMQVHSLVVSPEDDMRSWLKYASLCRRAGRLTLSNRTLVMLLGTDPATKPEEPLPCIHPQVTFAYIKHMWKSNKKTDAFLHLQTFVNTSLASQEYKNLANGAPSEELSKLLSRCYLKLGEWQENLHGITETSIPQILQFYSMAMEKDKSWYKVAHAWAYMNYEAALFYKQQDQQKHNMENQLPPAEGSESFSSIQDHSSLGSVKVFTSAEHVCKYAVPAVRGFFHSITLSHGSSLQDTLRLLTLWFDYGHMPEVNKAVTEGLKTVSIETWLQVIPQLIARIDTPRQHVGEVIHQLLVEIGKQHPQALIYPLTVAAKSNVPSRNNAANKVLDSMMKHSGNLVEQAKMVSEELIRVAILWHELWHEGLEEASRLYFGERNVKGMFAALEPLHAMIERGPQTLKETSFTQAYGRELAEAQECCKKYQRSGNVKDLTQAWDMYYHVFRRVTKQLPSLTSLELQYVSPKLLTSRNLELAVPGTYYPNQPIIQIAHVESSLQVITSKQRPRKLSIKGSNGKDFMFLLKGHEDLRQDERVMQLFGLVNTLLVKDPETSRRNVTIQRYSVIPLSTNSGLIGWVPHCDTLHTLIRDYREKKKILLNIEHRIMLRMAPDYDHLTLMQKVEVFEHALKNTNGDDLAKLLWLKSPSSEVWFDRRTNYTRSLAVMSMVGYVLGLGDRHPSNLMLDRLSGKILHIDFGDCFEVAMTREKFPEKIPFRLTRMLIHAMEVTGIEGTYRKTCQKVMKVLRDNKDSLMAVLEAFVYDPLLNWRLIDAQPKGKHSKNRSESSSSIHDQNDILEEVDVQSQADSKEGDSALIDSGFSQPEALNEKAVQIINRVRDKLTGRDFDPHKTLEVDEQVELLIKQATSHENLCQSYIGWCPFW